MSLLRGKLGHKRSARWPAVRRAHLRLQPTCQACGGRDHLEVHHVQVFHEHRDLELVESNLLTL